jgi:hypothetical protein
MLFPPYDEKSSHARCNDEYRNAKHYASEPFSFCVNCIRLVLCRKQKQHVTFRKSQPGDSLPAEFYVNRFIRMAFDEFYGPMTFSSASARKTGRHKNVVAAILVGIVNITDFLQSAVGRASGDDVAFRIHVTMVDLLRLMQKASRRSAKQREATYRHEQ